MDINISTFWGEFCPSDYSASAAEIGQSAGADTWRAAWEHRNEWPVLPNADAIDAFLAMVRSSGGWSDDDIRKWTNADVRSLALQWLASDMRDVFQLRFGQRIDPASIDWPAVRARMESGQVSGSFYRADDGQVFWGIYE
jgi:hypothetical protein